MAVVVIMNAYVDGRGGPELHGEPGRRERPQVEAGRPHACVRLYKIKKHFWNEIYGFKNKKLQLQLQLHNWCAETLNTKIPSAAMVYLLPSSKTSQK